MQNANAHVRPAANSHIRPAANPHVRPATNSHVRPATNPHVRLAANPQASDVPKGGQLNESARNRTQPLLFKDSILNGLDATSKSSPHSPGNVTERAYSSRNIIASNFNQNRQSEQSNESAKSKFSAEKSQSEDKSQRGPLSYDTMIDEQDISDYITPFLREFGLDDARCYTELSSDCFIRKTDVDSYTCALCCMRFPTNQSLDAHMSLPRHVDRFLNLKSNLLNTTPSPNSIHMIALQHLTSTWIRENSLTDAQTAARAAAIEDFHAILAEIDPRCHCRIIGSFMTGASLASSDVNMELLHQNNELFQSDPRARNSIHHKLVDPDAEYGNQINNHTMHYDLISNAADTLYKIAKSIDHGYFSVKSFRLKERNFCLDLNAKVPKLVLIHEPTNVRLEVWCYAESSHQLASLLKNYISLDERVRELSILVKHWAKLCNISNPRQGTFTPETFIILVIHFLQRLEDPVLPCLHELLCKNNDRTRKRSENAAEDSTHQSDRANQHESDVDDELARISGVETGALDNIDSVVDELEEDDEDAIEHDFDQAAIEGLNWKSLNTDPVHKLFVDFLKTSMREFAYSNQVISIRSLKRITIKDKKWNTEVKPIENPVKPSVNLAKNVGSLRTFDYIKRCFSHGYYYLTSIPMTVGLRRLAAPQNDPTGYIRLYLNLNRFDFYFKMRQQRISNGVKGGLVEEMIHQNLFARDVAVIKELVEYSIFHGRQLDTIPSTVARNYDSRLIMPPNEESTIFCWLCRGFGHEKNNCPKRTIVAIHSSEIEPTIDAYVNFDQGFENLFVNDAITPKRSEKHFEVVSELEKAIRSGTGLAVELQLFGSTVNLLGSFDSDLDICMTLIGNTTGHGVDCVKILKKTCEVLSKNEHVKNTIEPILAARVPIIKFKYDNFDVDLSMYNQCAIHNSKLLRSYVLIDFRVARLCYLVKQYAKSCSIADASRGSLSSYAWCLMVIHFLQQTDPPILPVLQERKNKPIVGVNGWNVWFNESFDPTTIINYNQTCLTTLFKQFLLYYAAFDFNQYVISIRTSSLITKFQKNWTYCMMAIEDPFELTYNLSGRLDDSMALYIMNSFPRTYKYIHRSQTSIVGRQQVFGPSIVRSLFNGRAIMGSEPPFRGCHICHRIGHRVKDCPDRAQNRARNSTKKETNSDRNAGQKSTPEVRNESNDRKYDKRQPPKPMAR